MLRAIRLAMRGRGLVEPNPMVGCVIVREDRIIGEGCHERFGGPHAEPNALKNCSEDPRGATAYVTLEPCCHANKKTPPCVPLLIAAKLGRIVVGCVDPNPLVAGKGIEIIRARKQPTIRVDVGVLEEQCRQLIAPFFLKQTRRRPYITLKWAESRDGKVAGPGGRRTRISNSLSHRLTHELRARCDAIVIGIGTALTDDPLLTVRGVPDARRRQLIRVVLDRSLRLPMESQLVRTTGEASPVVVCCDPQAEEDRAARLRQHGVIVVRVPSLIAAMNDLAARGVTHAMVEPGPMLARSFIAENLADRVWIFRSPVVIGDATAPSAATIDYPSTGSLALDGDELIEYLNPASEGFFSLSESADLMLARENASAG